MDNLGILGFVSIKKLPGGVITSSSLAISTFFAPLRPFKQNYYLSHGLAG